MKKLINSLFILGVLFAINACKEEPPYINFSPENTIGDTSYIISPVPSAELKSVLIEEFSGVKCANCPSAQVSAKAISTANPGRVNVVTVHPLNKLNALTRPFDKAGGDEFTSKYDFRTEAGALIFEMVGLTSGIPTGNVNRKLFSGEILPNIDYPKWSAYVNQELNSPTPVNINVNAKNIGDSIEVELTLTYTQAQTDSQYVTISILESEMEDIQESKDSTGATIFVENYIHRHVLRGIITSYFGDYLNASYVPGRVFYKKYRIKRDPKWNAANLDVVAFVHLNTTKKNVLHSKETKVN